MSECQKRRVSCRFLPSRSRCNIKHMEDEQEEGKGDMGVWPRRTGAWLLAEHGRGLLESRGVASRRAWVWPTGEQGRGLQGSRGVLFWRAGVWPQREHGYGLVVIGCVASWRAGRQPEGGRPSRRKFSRQMPTKCGAGASVVFSRSFKAFAQPPEMRARKCHACQSL